MMKETFAHIFTFYAMVPTKLNTLSEHPVTALCCWFKIDKNVEEICKCGFILHVMDIQDPLKPKSDLMRGLKYSNLTILRVIYFAV